MPELPEVETIRRGLEREVVGKRVKSVDVTGTRSVTVLFTITVSVTSRLETTLRVSITVSVTGRITVT